jgi:iron-sulfur cluster assembly protein
MTMTVKRERPKALKLTEAAAVRVREILAGAEPGAGLRVGVTGGGCAGMSYTMDIANAPAPLDEVVEDRGVRVFIDTKSVLYLIGSELDFVREKFGARFVFNNPNQTAACGCGESVALTPAKAD